MIDKFDKNEPNICNNKTILHTTEIAKHLQYIQEMITINYLFKWQENKIPVTILTTMSTEDRSQSTHTQW